MLNSRFDLCEVSGLALESVTCRSYANEVKQMYDAFYIPGSVYSDNHPRMVCAYYSGQLMKFNLHTNLMEESTEKFRTLFAGLQLHDHTIVTEGKNNSGSLAFWDPLLLKRKKVIVNQKLDCIIIWYIHLDDEYFAFTSYYGNIFAVNSKTDEIISIKCYKSDYLYNLKSDPKRFLAVGHGIAILEFDRKKKSLFFVRRKAVVGNFRNLESAKSFYSRRDKSEILVVISRGRGFFKSGEIYIMNLKLEILENMSIRHLQVTPFSLLQFSNNTFIMGGRRSLYKIEIVSDGGEISNGHNNSNSSEVERKKKYKYISNFSKIVDQVHKFDSDGSMRSSVLKWVDCNTKTCFLYVDASERNVKFFRCLWKMNEHHDPDYLERTEYVLENYCCKEGLLCRSIHFVTLKKKVYVSTVLLVE